VFTNHTPDKPSKYKGLKGFILGNLLPRIKKNIKENDIFKTKQNPPLTGGRRCNKMANATGFPDPVRVMRTQPSKPTTGILYAFRGIFKR